MLNCSQPLECSWGKGPQKEKKDPFISLSVIIGGSRRENEAENWCSIIVFFRLMDLGHEYYISACKWILCERPNDTCLTRAEVSGGGLGVNSDMLYLNERPPVRTLYTCSSLSLSLPPFPSLSLSLQSGLPLSSSSTCPCLNESRGALFLAPCHHPRGPCLPSPALFLRNALHDGKPVAPTLSPSPLYSRCPSFVRASDMCWRWSGAATAGMDVKEAEIRK